MAFIKEDIPEQYWDKLKRLGFDENIYYASWLADYKRNIFSWPIFSKEHVRNEHTMHWAILWKERKIIVRELVVDNSIDFFPNREIQVIIHHIDLPQCSWPCSRKKRK